MNHKTIYDLDGVTIITNVKHSQFQDRVQKYKLFAQQQYESDPDVVDRGSLLTVGAFIERHNEKYHRHDELTVLPSADDDNHFSLIDEDFI